MNHPSLDWKDLETNDLKESKVASKIISQHFRFSRLRDEEDYFKCFIWERARTETFLKLKPLYRNSFFPFNVKSFPNEPYLAISFKERSEWNLGIIKAFSESTNDGFFNLLEPYLGSPEEEEISRTDKTIFTCHTPTLKIPIELHIHPFWSSNQLVELFRKQINEIIAKVKINQEKLEVKGYEIFERKSKKPIKTYKKYLKLLGHFRLRHCVRLDQPKACMRYGGTTKDSYYDEATMWREIKKCYPRFKDLL